MSWVLLLNFHVPIKCWIRYKQTTLGSHIDYRENYLENCESVIAGKNGNFIHQIRIFNDELYTFV